MIWQKVSDLLSSPRWLLYLLPWFMLLLLLGTIAQRYIGLVDAQRLFFSSWILWLGPVPTPGGLTALSLLTLSLLWRLLAYSPWQGDKIGTILSHLGVLLLLLGGGMSYLLSQEGYLTLQEGQSSRQMQDYYAREATLWRDGIPLKHWPEKALRKGRALVIPHTRATLRVLDFCNNCGSYVQENPDGKQGIAQKIMLQSAPPAKEKEENKAGLTFSLHGMGKADGDYLAFELLASRAPTWRGDDGHRYQLTLARKAHPLPFTVKLLEFEKLRYPGSDQAKEYRSLVEIREGDSTSPIRHTIAMNEPLRLQGHALYQSSFLQLGSKQASVLSVVKNDAWLAPYLATAVLAIGLIWQVVLMRRQRK